MARDDDRSIAAASRYEEPAREALRAWPVEVESMRLVSHSENVAYRVDAADGARYTFRLHRPTYHTLAELESEQRFTEHLAHSGLSVPEIVPTRSGDGYERVTIGADEQRYAGLLRWVDGDVMLHRFDSMSTADIAAAYHSLGRLIARIHTVALDWNTPPGFVRTVLDADGFMGSAPFWGPFWDHPQFLPSEVSRLVRVRDVVHRRLESLSQDGVFSLIHADLHPGNVVVTPAGAHIIDFDDTAFGFHAFDFAVAVPGGWTMAGPDYRAEALISGYREVRVLDDETVALVPFFGLVRHLQHIGWIRHRPELAQPDWRDLARRTMALLDRWEEHLE